MNLKKRIWITLVLLACLLVSSVIAIAKNTTDGKNIFISTYLKIEILNDGKLSDNKMLVDLRIINVDGNDDISVDWSHVYINPVHESKKVVLKAQHFSTVNGLIKNVVVNDNNFSFVLYFLPTPFTELRTMQVVGNKKGGLYDVEATALWWSDILNRKIKTEWRTTDKKIVLPYKEVI